ncbi:MAG TPA: hypothetical protein VND98_12060 [Solirubrobacterales bacterium]|nr:hypothetical protein [Solirubrobacterales bacterium]
MAIVCGDAHEDEREPLREQVLNLIGAGEVTLYLDALDETRGMKRKVVTTIDEFLCSYKTKTTRWRLCSLRATPERLRAARLAP